MNNHMCSDCRFEMTHQKDMPCVECLGCRADNKVDHWEASYLYKVEQSRDNYKSAFEGLCEVIDIHLKMNFDDENVNTVIKVIKSEAEKLKQEVEA